MSISSSTHALSASHYADRAVWCAAEIADHVPLARDTYRLRFRAPDIACRIVPGQFVMLRLAGFADPLLGRALALFDVATNSSGEATDVEVVYMVVGKMTSRLTAFQRGQELEVWGPLGNGFSRPLTDHLVLAAGGVGITPFLAVAKQFLSGQRYGGEADSPARSPQPPASAPHVTLCYGVRSGEYFAAVDQFEQLGVDVRLSTDDGSRGHHGRVTDVLGEVLATAMIGKENEGVRSQETGEWPIPSVGGLSSPSTQPLVFCCGPEPMMEAVAKVCRTAGVGCHVSLETPMACGVGICFSCVAKVRQADGEWDYKRTCVEGPVFDAERIVWH